MPVRKPLVLLDDNTQAELPDGDTVPGTLGALDGGRANEVYTADQVIDGGDASGD